MFYIPRIKILTIFKCYVNEEISNQYLVQVC
jgi:hypothetical protein